MRANCTIQSLRSCTGMAPKGPHLGQRGPPGDERLTQLSPTVADSYQNFLQLTVLATGKREVEPRCLLASSMTDLVTASSVRTTCS